MNRELVLDVMSYNIHAGIGNDGNLDIARIGKVIRRSRAGVVALNEVDCKTERSEGICEGKRIAEDLNYHWVFGKAIDYRGGEYGNALLAKYPITLIKNHRLPAASPKDDDQSGSSEARSLLECRLDIDGRKLNLLVTHLSLLSRERIMAAKYIRGLVRELPGSVVLMGDFNGESGSREIKIIETVLKDSFKEAGGQGLMTFTSKNPEARIDYIFVSESIKVKAVDTIQSMASDHLPVTASLML